MNIESVLYPALLLGGLGLLFGIGLAYASKKFAVELDPRITAIRDVLPGANCGGCGIPGCDGFAKAVVDGEAGVGDCPVGGPDCTKAIAKIMGVEADTKERQVAKVICNGDTHKCKEKYEYQGINDCVAASLVSGGSKACDYGCLGLGTCVRACQFDAIEIVDGRIAKIIPEKCTACKKCVESCPKDVIDMVPYEQSVVITCNNNETGKVVRPKCSVACIACKICVKACPFDAIDFENNLAFIDYEKCTNCFVCVEKCPTKAIEGRLEKKEV
ncbi:RnfABCDGE type electron transport complex subunit B [Serpentinicella sp. ANB-PHB4]|uniref:RnfABCDGE type electron transport complex subunit B n=1 Tax=Serpentinicella sp. ANB-PHB4 TaxID=3074076 RepID=UPI002856AAB6|nr:RnfABCDGE type electron transport complex subunit B [Serpentinicella sp. ANB-PHB4]MDR5657882.1 RnfABCDGE type electron transport complex subunit B [Serpentinicella sp. ANB-PHB4]